MKVISLFSGAGGLDLGLEAAGFSIAVCVEVNNDAKVTIKHNRPRWKLMEPGDIYCHRPEEVLEYAKITNREPTLLSAGFPCQPFSKAAMWVNGRIPGLSNTKSNIIKCLIKFINIALPQFVLLENVKSFLSPQKAGGYNFLKAGLEYINKKNNTKYKWSILQLNAADYGVPQTRERVFLLADKDGRILDCPPETHSESPNNRLKPYITSWEAIGDLDIRCFDKELVSKGKWKNLLPSIPEGKNYLWHTKKGGGLPLFGWRTKYWSFLLKLDKKRPSWTLPASPGPATGPFHWRNRLLSRKELARLQTFPDHYKILGSYGSVRRQIGNAVPPLIGEVLGREIMKQWVGQIVNHKLSFIQNRFTKEPTRSRIGSVPKEYLRLVGHHSDHPGYRKGPGAISRKEIL